MAGHLVVGTYEMYLSFYECRLSGGDNQEVVDVLKPYLLQSNLFKLFALRGGRDTDTSSLSPLTYLHLLMPEPPCETSHLLCFIFDLQLSDKITENE